MFREIGEERAFDGILKQIIENIQTGNLKAGAALPAERTMAETMGVSRPAVREVLRALELLGIVKSVPGGGNYITQLHYRKSGYLADRATVHSVPAE